MIATVHGEGKERCGGGDKSVDEERERKREREREVKGERESERETTPRERAAAVLMRAEARQVCVDCFAASISASF